MALFATFPFLRYVGFLIIGIMLYPFISPNINVILSIWLVGVLLYVILAQSKVFRFQKSIVGILGLLTVVLLGYVLAYFNDDLNNPRHFSHQAGQVSLLNISVHSLVEEKANSWKATCEVQQVLRGDSIFATKGQMLLYFDKNSLSKPQYGDIFWIKAQLQSINAPLNPDEFDYRVYLLRQNITHQQYVTAKQVYPVSSAKSWSILGAAIALNEWCDAVFTQYLHQKNNYAVANAMILGLRDDLDNAIIQAYTASGAIHVLSVSGMHVGVIYQVLLLLLGFLNKKGTWGKTLFVVLIFMILWFYALLTGLSSPVLRSTVMFSVFLLANSINRKQNSYNTLAFSAFCLLLFNPNYIYQVGFQLSYLAVLGMIFFYPMIAKLWIIEVKKGIFYKVLDYLWQMTAVSLAAQLATLPFTIYYFHQFPVYFLIVNPFVIVLSSVVLCYGLLFIVLVPVLQYLGFLQLIKAMAWLLQGVIYALNQSVEITERLPHSVVRFLHFNVVEMVLWFGLLLGLGFLVKFRNYAWVKINTTLILVLGIFNVIGFLAHRHQIHLMIHATPKHSVMSVLNGTNALILADSSFLRSKKDLSFRLTNYLAKQRIQDTLSSHWTASSTDEYYRGYNMALETHPSGMVVMSYYAKKIVYLHRPQPTKSLKLQGIKVDYLIVANKAIRDIKEVKDMAFKTLIIDASYTDWYARKLLNQAKALQIEARYLKDTGAIYLY